MTCKGLCKKYHTKATGYDILNSIKKCLGDCPKSFMKVEGINCPCCGVILRTRTRSSKRRISIEREEETIKIKVR